MGKQKLPSLPHSCLTDAMGAFMHPEGEASITLPARAACASLSQSKHSSAGCSQHRHSGGSGWHCWHLCEPQTQNCCGTPPTSSLSQLLWRLDGDSAVLGMSPHTGKEMQGAGRMFDPSRCPMGHPGCGLDHGKAHIMSPYEFLSPLLLHSFPTLLNPLQMVLPSPQL